MYPNQIYPLRNESRCIWKEINKDTIILSHDGQWLHQLNGIGAVIWNQCNGFTSIIEIISNICKEFAVEEERARKDVLRFIEGLSAKDLIIYKDK